MAGSAPNNSNVPPATTDFDQRLQGYRERVEAVIDRWVPSAETHPGRLHQAMRYATLNGGKRLRPVLTYAVADALGLTLEKVDSIACAVELIHCYSLIHDDLPAMDDDDLRRGRPTCHRAYDEATAILAGDALQALAFYILAHDPRLNADAETRLRMIEHLALACGSRGMAGGQAIDLVSVGKRLDIAQLEDMHIHKTGALIRAAILLAAFAEPSLRPDGLDALDRYAKFLGLAFQIRDDILDIEGDPALMGKTPGADLALAKPTYPSVLGLDDAKQRALELHQRAIDALKDWDHSADGLRQLARVIVERVH